MEDRFVLGAIESPTDLRDYDYSMVTGSSDKIDIPEKFELDYDIPIQNQGNVGSCVAHALMEMKSYIDNSMYSIGFIYGNRCNTDYQGHGLVPREALKRLVKDGDCFKESFNFNIEYPTIRNKMAEVGIDKLLTEAAEHKSLSYISLNAGEIKEYLVKYKKPIMIVVKVYQNFYTSQNNKGIIPSEPVGAYKGNHAMVIVGYDRDTLKIVNSWGNTGDNGYYYLDINSSIIRELWALEDEKNVNRPEKKKYTVGWNKDNKGWWYSPDGLTYYKGDWKQINGNWFCFDDEGYAMQNKWTKYKNKWYYLDKDCYMVSNKWIKYKDKWYRLGQDGAMLTGWFKDSNDKWCYLDIEKGYAYKDCTILIDGKYYSFDEHCYWIENNGGVSDSLVDFVKGYEGYFDHWYDAGDGYDTIGYGTATSGKVGQRLKSQGITFCTESQATEWLKEEINNMADSITEKLNAARITLKQCQFDALASFAYNCGTYSLFNSTLWRYVISNRSASDIQSAFLMWNKCNGRALEGLTKRRQAESNMYNYGVYDSTH